MGCVSHQNIGGLGHCFTIKGDRTHHSQIYSVDLNQSNYIMSKTIVNCATNSPAIRTGKPAFLPPKKNQRHPKEPQRPRLLGQWKLILVSRPIHCLTRPVADRPVPLQNLLQFVWQHLYCYDSMTFTSGHVSGIVKVKVKASQTHRMRSFWILNTVSCTIPRSPLKRHAQLHGEGDMCCMLYRLTSTSCIPIVCVAHQQPVITGFPSCRFKKIRL